MILNNSNAFINKNNYILLVYHIIFLFILLFLFYFCIVDFDFIFNIKMAFNPSFYSSLITYFDGKFGFITLICGIIFNIFYLGQAIKNNLPFPKRIFFIHALSPFYGGVVAFYINEVIFLNYGLWGQICGSLLFNIYPLYRLYILIMWNIFFIFVYLRFAFIKQIFLGICNIVIFLKIPNILLFIYQNAIAWIFYIIPFLKKKRINQAISIESLIAKSIEKDFQNIFYIFLEEKKEILQFDNKNETIASLFIKNKKNSHIAYFVQKVLIKDDCLPIIEALNYYQIKTVFESGLEGPHLHTVILTPSCQLHKIYQLEADLGRIIGKSDLCIIYPVKNFPHSVGFQYAHNKIIPIDFFPYFFDSVFLSSEPLVVILGLDAEGSLFYLNIAKAPHVLLSGTTGSGKSSVLLTMIAALIWKNTPQEIEIILIDPKKSEFFIVDKFPHIKKPIAYTIQEIESVILFLVKTMEDRYEILNEKKCKNIEEYNQNNFKMSYIVVFIDEYADIVIQAKYLEIKIIRLLSMARAAGIHIIIATQRPSVDIITGTLKSNLPVRISCKVINETNSRIILDKGGAEKLLGNGDMIILLHNKYYRVHGFFINTVFFQEMLR